MLSLRVNKDWPAELMKLLEAPFPEHADLQGDAARQEGRAARILERAWAAEKLGQLGAKTVRTVHLLEQVVENRSLHRDWAYLGLDGVLAARALGLLRAVEAVPILVRAFRRVDPALEGLVQAPAQYPYAWGDFHIKSEIIATLGELPCRESRSFLLHYVTP